MSYQPPLVFMKTSRVPFWRWISSPTRGPQDQSFSCSHCLVDKDKHVPDLVWNKRYYMIYYMVVLYNYITLYTPINNHRLWFVFVSHFSDDFWPSRLNKPHVWRVQSHVNRISCWQKSNPFASPNRPSDPGIQPWFGAHQNLVLANTNCDHLTCGVIIPCRCQQTWLVRKFLTRKRVYTFEKIIELI